MGKKKKPKNKNTNIRKEGPPKEVLRKTKKKKKWAKEPSYASFVANLRKASVPPQQSAASASKSGPTTKTKSLRSWKTVIDTAQDVAVVDLKPGCTAVDFARIGKKTKKQKALEKAKARTGADLKSFKTSVLPSNVLTGTLFESSTEENDTGTSSDDVCIVDMEGQQTGTTRKVSQNATQDTSWLKQFKIPKRKHFQENAPSSKKNPHNPHEKPTPTGSPSTPHQAMPNPPRHSPRHPKRFQESASVNHQDQHREPPVIYSPTTSQQQTPSSSHQEPPVGQLLRVQLEESAAMSSGVSSGRSEIESDFSETEFMSAESEDEIHASPGQMIRSTPPETVPCATYAKIRARILPNTIPTHCVAVIHPLSLLPFYGQVKMTVICGEVKVHGCIATAGSRSLVLYSPNSSPALCLETSDKKITFEGEGTITEHELKGKLKNVFLTDFAEGMMGEVVREVRERGASVVVLEPHWSDRTDYITSFHVYEGLFEQRGQKMSKSKAQQKIMSEAWDIGFIPVKPDRNIKLLRAPPVYHEVTKTVLQSLSQSGPGRPPIVLVCGWRNAGKSTLARYLINSMLNMTNSVCFLDCDVGQTEFNPPTMLGITKVTEPLLGPPFTHNVKPEKMCFFGDASPSSSPAVYIRLLRHLFLYYVNNLQDLPLVVNCMGWMKGLGLGLLVDTIRLTQPSHIVQLLPTPTPKNACILNSKYLQQARGWSRHDIRGPSRGEPWEPKHMLLRMPWAAEEGKKYKAANHRELSLLGYLSQLMPPKLKFHNPLANFHPLSALIPVSVPWKLVAVHVCNSEVPPSQLMYSLNASIVGLCKADPEQMVSLRSGEPDDLPKIFHSTPICECLGLGIIRGIDPVQKMFYILTHLPEITLKEVNALLKGSLALPQFVLQQGQRKGAAPYVTSEFPHDVTGAGSIKVRYMVPKNQAK